MNKFLIIFSFLILSCSDKKEVSSSNSFDTLFLADCLKDLNIETKNNCTTYLDKYYLKEEDIGKEQTATLMHYFGLGAYLYKEKIDSLYKNIPHILFGDNTEFTLDTTTYISSPNIVPDNRYENEVLKKDVILYVNNLASIQDSLYDIQHEIEKTRVGPKKEKIICQLSRQKISTAGLNKCTSNSELFLETEKQFNIIYRELECTLFSIELTNKWKSATNHYKIRI